MVLTVPPTRTASHIIPAEPDDLRASGRATHRRGHLIPVTAVFSTDVVEALVNAIIGLAASWAATRFVLGYGAGQSAAITAMFFGLSFSRAYILRRVFRWLS